MRGISTISTSRHLQQPLFRDGIVGRRVTETKLSSAGRNLAEPLPFTEDSFPWLKTIPWHPVGHQNYGKPLHLSMFSGFEVTLYQIDERFRCEKFDNHLAQGQRCAGSARRKRLLLAAAALL
jgi:hypothetical protein